MDRHLSDSDQHRHLAETIADTDSPPNSVPPGQDCTVSDLSDTDKRSYLETRDISISRQSFWSNKAMQQLAEQPEMPQQRYLLGEPLGCGGSGRVFLCQDSHLDRTIAIKIQNNPANHSDRMGRQAKFLKEAATTARLDHPNITPIYDLDLTRDGHLFLAMKNIVGQSLDNLIRQSIEGNARIDRLADPNWIASTFLRICDALSFAHAKGVLHRDVKPANIMIGEFGEVLLIDWGASSEAGSAGLLGTPIFMAPEQARQEHGDRRSDVYCLGGTLLNVLALRYPVLSDSAEVFWAKKKSGLIDPVTPAEHKAVSPRLMAIALKALEADPQDRYQSIEDMAQDLRRFQAGESISVFRDSPMERAIRFYRKNSRLCQMTGGFLAIILLVLGLYLKQHTEMILAQLKTFQLETEMIQAQLKTFQLEEERREHWNPVLSQDFSNPQIDQRLNIPRRDIVDGVLNLGYRSSIKQIEIWNAPLAEPRVELTFRCAAVPSFQIAFMRMPDRLVRTITIAELVSAEGYYPEFSVLSVSDKSLRNALHFDRPNRLACWLRNSVWHVEINGEPFLRFYDREAAISDEQLSIRLHATRITGELSIQRVALNERLAPKYVSILEPGRVLSRSGHKDEARKWFQARRTDDLALKREALFLAATTSAGQDRATQLSELEAILQDPGSPFRSQALTHKARLLATGNQWRQALGLVADAVESMGNQQPFRLVWQSHLRSACQQRLGEREKLELLRKIASLPLQELSLQRMNLAQLDFFQGRPGESLHTLNLYSNSIADISPLAGCKLYSLDLGKNNITDLSVLRNMPLKVLGLSETPVTNLSPLAGKSLESLYMKRCKHLDLSTLKKIKAARLVLDGTPVDDPTAVSATQASVLRMSSCSLTDLEFLQTMQPVVFKASRNQISSLKGLEGQSLDELILNGNLISDLKPLQHCTVRRILTLSANPIADISPLRNLQATSLHLSDTLVTDLSALGSMPHLKEIFLTGRYEGRTLPPRLETLGNAAIPKVSLKNLGIRDIKGLAGCTISDLDLSGNPICDLTPLADMPLANLNLGDTLISDLAPLKQHAHLRSLAISHQRTGKPPLLKLSPLKGIQIHTLQLGNYRIKDYSPLMDCSRLSRLYLHAIPLTDLTELKGLTCKYLQFQEGPLTALTGIRSIRTHSLTVNGKADKTGLRTDISALARTAWGELQLKNVGLQDISVLQTCTIESFLNIADNPIADISPLAGQPLHYLNIANTKVKDLSVLPTLKNLRRININGLELDQANRALLKSLPVVITSK